MLANRLALFCTFAVVTAFALNGWDASAQQEKKKEKKKVEKVVTSVWTDASDPTLPPDFKGENTCAEIRVHPNGKGDTRKLNHTVGTLVAEAIAQILSRQGYSAFVATQPRDTALIQ